MPDLVVKIVLFLVAGGVGFAIDLLIATQLIKQLKVKLLYANTVGFMVGVCVKYLINRVITFKSDDPQIFIQFLQFFIISMIGLLMVNYIIYFLHVKKEKKFFFSKVMSMSVFMIWNFTANYFITFAEKPLFQGFIEFWKF